MLQSHLADLPRGSDALLVVTCKLFQDHLDVYAAAADRLGRAEQRGDGAEYDRLLRQLAELRAEWQALGRGIAAVPAVQLVGFRAKARALHAYLQYVGDLEEIEGIGCELTRSLVGDLGRG